MKKSISAVLIAAMTLGTLSVTSCGEEETVKLTNVFKETKITLPEEYDSTSLSLGSLTVVGDKLYSVSSSYDSNTGVSSSFLLPVEFDGTIGEALPINTPKPDENGSGGGYMSCYAFLPDGGFCMNYTSYSYDYETGYTESNELRYFASLGDEEYETIDISELTDEDGNSFYFYRMVAAPDGSLILSSWNQLAIMGTDRKLRIIDTGDEDMEFNSFLQVGDKVYVSVYNYGSEVRASMVEVDTANAELGESHTLPSTNIMYNLMPGAGEYDYFYSDSNSVWGGKLDDDEIVEVLNFINSDIDGSSVYNIAAVSADRFFAVSYDDDTYKENYVFFDRIPDEQVANREIITLATTYLDYNLRKSILSFNKSNDKYRIIVNDYSIYQTDDDYDAGATRLAADLTSGKLPDILEIDDSIPFDTYAAKKLFTDIYTLMDSDESFNREDYLENILEACETDGKLYSLITRFRIRTLAAKTDNLDGIEGWTVDEFMQFAKEHPEFRMFDYEYNRSNFLEFIIKFTKDSFIDRDTGECSFNSEGFKSILEFAKEYLTTDDFWGSIDYDEVGDEFWNEYESRFSEDRVLLMEYSLNNLVTTYKSLMNYTFKADVSFVGFPCEEGNGSAIYPALEFSIINKSKHQEGAWEFLKSFISEDAQMPTQNNWGGWSYGTGLPILKKAIEKQLEIAMTPLETSNDLVLGDDGIMFGSATVTADTEAAEAETTEALTDDEVVDANGDGVVDAVTDADGDGVVSEIDLPEYIDDVVVIPSISVSSTIEYLSEAQAAELRRVVTGAKQVVRSDSELVSIINEEAEYYFADQKSLDTIVEIIQNRAETYIAESR